MRYTVAALAVMYVAERQAGGHIEKSTARQLRYRLRDFAAHMPASPKRIARKHIAAWMQRPEMSPSYLRQRLGAARGFCHWAIANGHMTKDPTLGFKAPRAPEGVPKRMTREEACRLAEVARRDPRTRLIVSLSLQEALRRMEVARLRVEDIDFAERTVMVKGKGGKGAVTDVLPLSDETWQALTDYLALKGHRHGPLIRNRRVPTEGISPDYVSDIIRNAMVEAGVKRPGDPSKTPHSTRHTAAHDMLDRTQNVRAVQQALRHRSVRSTEVYLRGHVAELRPVMDGRSYFARGLSEAAS